MTGIVFKSEFAITFKLDEYVYLTIPHRYNSNLIKGLKHSPNQL